MYPFALPSPLLLLTVIRLIALLVPLARCDDAYYLPADPPFLFPSADRLQSPPPHHSKSNIYTLELSNLSLTNGELIKLEYTPSPYIKAVGISTQCYVGLYEVTEIYPWGSNLLNNTGWRWTGPYNATGSLLWTFDLTGDFSTGAIKFCQFLLWNVTIDSCSWGAWRQRDSSYMSLSQTWAPGAYDPISYSPIFNVLQSNGSTLGVVATSKGLISAQATPDDLVQGTTVVTCPPLGIPPSPLPPVETQLSIYPPLVPGVEFPYSPWPRV